ncbi:MAG: GDYXXLXY domain-containing protein [Bacillota bacterium]
MYNKKKFIIAVAIPVLILSAMAVQPVLTLFFGKEILLETRPFDPRDIFRGDYVELAYKIEEVPLEKFPPELLALADNSEEKKSVLKKMETVYGILKEDNGHMILDYISLGKPKDSLYIKGKIPSYYVFLYRDKHSSNPIFIDFGLDRYFVPENTGKDLEEAARQGKLAAKVKVLNGYGILIDITSLVSD